MEHPPDPRSFSRDQKCVGAAERNVPPRTRQGTKLRDMLRSDKPNLSYADFHHEITRNPDAVLPKYVGTQNSQVLERTTSKEEELVRYMSNLPTYLEKGMNSQEKALNVGVLDWKRLEKWRYSQKQMPHKQNGYSPSSSNTSIFSTDGSSTHSSRGQSCSPARQRMHRLSLQSPLEASPKEGHVQDTNSSSGRGHSCSPAHQLHKPVVQSHPQEIYAGGRSQNIDVFGANSGKFQDSTFSTGNHLCNQQKVLSALQRCERKDCDLKSVSEMGQRLAFDKYEVPAPWKGKTKIQGGETTKQTLKLQETKMEAAGRDCSERENIGVRIKPTDQSENRRAGVVTSSGFTMNGQLSIEPDGKIISERNKYDDQLPYKHDKHSRPTGSCSRNPEGVKNSSHAPHTSLHSTKMFQSPSRISAQGVKGPSSASHMLSFPTRMLSSPSRSRNSEEKQPVTGIRRASAAKPSEDLDVRNSSESIPKVRNPSPIRRLSFAMGRMIKNAGSRDSSPLRRPSSKDCVARSGSEGAIASLSIDNPSSDKLSATNNRGRSSPLRRLLDPLLKPRASSSSEPSKKHSAPMAGTVKSRNDHLDFAPGHSSKVKSRSTGGSTTSASGSHQNSKNGTSSVQALLQVSFKNGFPLFTFAIDNESDILAATVRKSFVPGKGHSWTYTFFTVREIKRKSGIWLNQGGKGDGHGYVPNVVAQMKVSDSQGSFAKHEYADDQITREFDLFAVDVAHGDQYATDFRPTNELAAIVSKLPRSTSANPSKDDESSFDWLDSSQTCFRENSEGKRADDDSQNDHSFGSLKLMTTVILPGGVHTVPSRGEISTLAHRWRSGGSCDCGGWDLGCQLQVFSNRRGTRTSSSATCPSEDKFQLFSQVGQDNQLMLSLAPFKERIYSVEFNSSLSLLQAFAICISHIDRRRPAELSESSNVVDKINNNEVGVFEVPVRMKTSTHQVDAPARYVSYPPHSPVGRV